jgi:hypothetical protein
MQLYIIQHTLSGGCLSLDPILSVVSLSMKLMYEKYWGNMDNINFMMYVAFILDPCSKLGALVFWLTKCNGPKWAKKIEGMVKALLKHLMD